MKKNLHQIWSKGSLPVKYKLLQKSLIDLHPDWNYKLWNLDECRNLIKEKYNFFLKTFDNYQYDIQRIDSARIFILNEYGGLYCDLDIHFYKNLQPLLENKQAIFFESYDQIGTKNKKIIDNYVMYNNNSKFFKNIIKKIPFLLKGYNRDITDLRKNIYYGCGHNFISNLRKIDKYDSEVLSSKYFEYYYTDEKYKGEDFIYGIHLNHKTWFDNQNISL